MTKARARQETDPRYAAASINPVALRYLAATLRERGCDPARLCRGLGFDVEDLERPGFRISYRQASLMIRRSLEATGDGGLGFAVGRRETIVSWGLVGFAMMCCATLGDAVELGLTYQQSAGALTNLSLRTDERHCALLADQLYSDPDIEMYLIEEMFASFVAVMHQMVGPQFFPARIEVVYQAPQHSALYEATFRCPVRFGAPRNRYIMDRSWTRFLLPTHDSLVGKTVQKLIEQTLVEEQERLDLIATVERAIRERLARRPPTLQEIAARQNTSERTLRRRLADAGFTYNGLLESVRRARALELVNHSLSPIGEVAHETGFSDIRGFRRAFKRWTGVPPNEARGLTIRAKWPPSEAAPGTDASRPSSPDSEQV